MRHTRLLLAASMSILAAGAAAQERTPPAPPANVPAETRQRAPETPTPAEAPAARNARLNTPLTEAESALKAHVMFLASDAMRGRDAGSSEYDIAAQYVAAQYYAAGLRPAGDDGGYLQRVPLLRVKAADRGEMTWTPRGGAATPLAFGQDYVPSVNAARAETTVEAPIVFVGYGLVSATAKRDDYAGANVRGKIVAVLSGAPDTFDSEERAHFGGIGSKAALAEARGAVGVIVIEPNASARAGGFARMAQGYDGTRILWQRKDGTGFNASPGAPVLGTISQAGAAKLFGPRWADVQRVLESPANTVRPFDVPGRLKATIRTQTEVMPSSNVVGLLPGSDARLKDEYVVLTAHLDHVGVGRGVNGDTIYNGAMDNAVGIASMIEEARRFKASGQAPRRSVLFVAVTAEEKGLVGSDYFAHNPTVPKDRIVANVNLDMPIITYPFEDVIAFGARRSTLGPIVERAAAKAGVGFSPDPMPEQALFVRSDHYRFVQQGVPVVFLWPGVKGPGEAAVARFMANNYHKPSDEPWNGEMDWKQGVRFVDVNYAITREIADAPERPRWNRGDFFGTLYDGFGAK